MKRVRIMTGTLVALIALTATVFAQPGERGCGDKGKHGPRGEGPLAALDLSDTQKEQIKALHEQFEEDNAATLERMKTLHEQAREQMKSGDKEGAQATREQMKEVRESLREAHEDLRTQVEALLTDEQKAQLEEMKTKREGRKGKKGKRGEGAREGGTGGTPPNIR